MSALGLAQFKSSPPTPKDKENESEFTTYLIIVVHQPKGLHKQALIGEKNEQTESKSCCRGFESFLIDAKHGEKTSSDWR